jgi:hypothetical protein
MFEQKLLLFISTIFWRRTKKKYLLHDEESNQPKSCYIITTRIRILKFSGLAATLKKHLSKKRTIFVFAKNRFNISHKKVVVTVALEARFSF